MKRRRDSWSIVASRVVAAANTRQIHRGLDTQQHQPVRPGCRHADSSTNDRTQRGTRRWDPRQQAAGKAVKARKQANLWWAPVLAALQLPRSEAAGAPKGELPSRDCSAHYEASGLRVAEAATTGLPRLHWDQRNLEARIPADHPHLERVVKGPANQHSVDVVYRSYGAFVERDNEVSLAQPSNRGWTVGFDGDELHHLRCHSAIAPRDEAVDRAGLPDDSQMSAADVAAHQQLAYHPLGGVDRDGEADALSHPNDGGIDSDDARPRVNQGTPRGARVQRNLSLNDVFDQLPRRTAQGSTDRADHTRRHG